MGSPRSYLRRMGEIFQKVRRNVFFKKEENSKREISEKKKKKIISSLSIFSSLSSFFRKATENQLQVNSSSFDLFIRLRFLS